MNFIQETCNQIVVPPKLRYSLMDLGYSMTNHYRRHDFHALNNEKQILKCSLYVPKTPHSSKVCVTYLHSMNGSRLQCVSYVDNIIKRGLYMCSFDFSGCGCSEGISISFGANEKFDIKQVLQQLANNYGLRKHILWGRSMGAVASIKYCEFRNEINSKIQILGVILDSPFESLKKLIIQLGSRRSDIPKFFVHLFYLIIQSTLEKKGNFNVNQLELTNSMKKIEGIPICFLASKDDTTIDFSHTQNLYKSYSHWDKKIVYFKGLHNQSRNQEYIKNVMYFIEEKINRVKQERKVQKYKRVNLENQLLNKSKSSSVDFFQTTNQCQCNLFKN